MQKISLWENLLSTSTSEAWHPLGVIRHSLICANPRSVFIKTVTLNDDECASKPKTRLSIKLLTTILLQDSKGISHAGFVSWFIWRSAYLTRVVSWRNRFYVAVNWATTLVFGRDNSRIG